MNTKVQLPIEELDLNLFDVGRLQVSPPLYVRSNIVPRTRFRSLHLHGVAFAGLDEIHLRHQVRLAVDLNLQSLPKVAGLVRSTCSLPYFVFPR